VNPLYLVFVHNTAFSLGDRDRDRVMVFNATFNSISLISLISFLDADGME